MIGHLIGAYCDGRSDARHGQKRPPRAGESCETRTAYNLGHADERKRMDAQQRLAQVRMPLEVPERPPSPRPAPTPVRRRRRREPPAQQINAFGDDALGS